MTTLDDICIDNSYSITSGGSVITSGPESGAVRTRKKTNVTASEVFGISWTALSKTQFQTIMSVFKASFLSGGLNWTPPTEGSARAFAVQKLKTIEMSANSATIEAELVALPNVVIS